MYQKSLIFFYFISISFPFLAKNSSFDLDGFAEASMDFEDMNVVDYGDRIEDENNHRLPDNHESSVVKESSEQSFQFTDKESSNNNSSGDHLESTESSPNAAQVVESEPVGGFEYETSMHLSEVFRLSHITETPSVLQAAATNGPGKLSSFLESGGGDGATRLGGVRKWIKDKLDEQDEDNGNDARSKSVRSQPDDESFISESTGQMSGTNFGGGCGAWGPKSSPPPV